RRTNELVAFVPAVGVLDRLLSGGGMESLAVDERIPSQLGPFPAAVAVHGVIAALDGPDRRLGADAVLELDQEPFGGPGRRVPAVGEGMQDDAVRRQPEPMSELHESLDVLVDCVDA